MAIKRIPFYTCLLNGQPADTVSARDLHTFLQLDRDFFEWVNTQRTKLYFVRDRDFVLIDNLIRPSDTASAVQKTKDYFISLDMAYEMAMEEDSDLAKQASDYLRHGDTPQNRYIPPQDTPQVQRRLHLALTATTPLPISAHVRQSDLDQYSELSKVAKASVPDEDLVVLPIHEISKTIETLSLYRDKTIELHALSIWMDQHITNLKTHINRQFMDN
ncbi:antA/AntB antirepressor family protein [Marinomonas transparens]|uniref:AntA/AntB antirepressor family protein n=1 Tax=Marinomonas transparens TaxID=2795388 RepID=A0A934JR54_9GAMM|nr:antA/AntB antirepressor family protein [Marinomonas transparens]MBJ7538308.1 antA/AntB antirepressor family protein [Marinomonas transparens]